MADVTVHGTIAANQTARSPRLLAFSRTDPDVGYHFYIDDNSNVVYSKTTDGGASWGTPVVIHSGTSNIACDIWPDWWTPGDTGTLIHIWWFASAGANSDDVVYRTLDTADDSLGTLVTVFTGGTAVAGRGAFVSGTKTRSGYLYCAFDIDAGAERGLHRSTDGGANWSADLDDTFVEATIDQCTLFPASNTGDDNDCWAIYHDASTDELTLKMWDSSAGSAVESAVIMTLVENGTDNVGQFGWSASVRHSDGHLILAAVSALDTSTSDHRVFDINGTGSITELTAITTNIDDHYYPQVFIDQTTDDLYVAFNGLRDGSEAMGGTTKVYYTKSTDGGTTWSSGSTAYMEGAAALIRQVWAPLMGPRFYVSWREGTVLNGNKVNSLAFGAADLTGAHIASGVALFAAALAYVVAPPAIAAGATLQAPTVAYAVTAPAIAAASALHAPTVAYAVTAPTLASGAALFAPTVDDGTQTLTGAFIASGAALAVPSVASGVELPAIAGGSALAAPVVTTTKIYYVRTDGNDANDGLSNSPSGAWQTSRKASRSLAPGDTLLSQADGDIVFEPTEFVETAGPAIDWITEPPGGFGTSWDAGQRIKIAAAPGCHGLVTLKRDTASGSAVVDMRAFSASASARFVAFHNLIFDGFKNSLGAKGFVPVYMNGTPRTDNTVHDIRFYGCECKNSAQSSGLFQESTTTAGAGVPFNLLFTKDDATGRGGKLTDNGTSTLQHGCYLQGRDSEISWTEVSGSGGLGIQIHRDSPGADNCDDIYLHHIITHHNGQSGIYYGIGANGRMHNILAYRNGTHGIRVDDGATDWEMMNCTSVANVTANFTTAATAAVGPGVIINCVARKLGITANNFSDNGMTPTITTCTNIAIADTDATDPLFVDPGADDFHLQSGSPCRDAGTDTSADGVIDDLLGTPRNDGVYDQGAFEFFTGGDQALTGAFLASGSTLTAPTLAHAVELPALASGSTLAAPALAAVVAPPVLSSGAVLSVPSVAYGVEAAHISSSATLAPPSVEGGAQATEVGAGPLGCGPSAGQGAAVTSGTLRVEVTS